MNTATQLIKKQIDEALIEFFNEKRAAFAADGSQFDKEIDVLADFVLQGGKRVRPLLVAGAFLLQAEQMSPRVIKAAMAYELFHAGLLIQDDVMDQDRLRRGNPTVHTRYKNQFNKYNVEAAAAEHHGESIAMCIGDLSLSFGYELLVQGSKHDPQAFELVQRSLYQVYEGQILDITSNIYDVSLDDLIRQYYLKTAGYSFIGPMSLGGHLVKLTKEDRDCLEQLGEACGLAFQIIDDVICAFATEEETGKPKYSDFIKGKPTILTVVAEQKAQEHDKQYLQKHIGKTDLISAEGARLCQIITETGALEYAITTVRTYVDQAYAILEKLPDGKGRLILWDIVGYLDNKVKHYS